MALEAKEIERQATRIDEEIMNFNDYARRTINALNRLSRTVKSEDSSLSSEIEKYKEMYLSIQKSLYTKFHDLADIMHNYSKKTTANEQNVATEVEKMSDELDSLYSQISNLNFD